MKGREKDAAKVDKLIKDLKELGVDQHGNPLKKSTNNEEAPMAKKSKREEAVAYLVTNCGFKEKVLSNAETFTDADLEKLVANAKLAGEAEATVNALREKFNAPELTLNAMPQFFKKKGEDEEEEEEEEEVMPKCNKATMTTEITVTKPDKPKKLTRNEWLAQMPQDAQEEWAMVSNAHKELRTDFIKRLVANADLDDPKDEETLAKTYSAMPTPTLKVLVNAIPKRQDENEQPERRERGFDFSGAGYPGYVSNSRDDEDEIPVLDLAANRAEALAEINQK